MACIGLYDIELWHRGKVMPNLELMKIYNYHYNKGDKVVMMRPNENEGRFNQIIYFKDNPNTQIPKTLHLSGPLKQILMAFILWKKNTRMRRRPIFLMNLLQKKCQLRFITK